MAWFLRVLKGILSGRGVSWTAPTSWTGYRKVNFKRPVDPKWPVSARYGAKGPWWNWHIDDNGKWRQGQISGMGQHKGIDFAVPVGTPVYAMCDGVVEAAGWENPDDSKQGFGQRIRQTFTHEGSIWRAYYGHLSALKLVEGTKIQAGDLIAFSGESGHVTGPHLHVEIRDTEGQQHAIPFEGA